MPFEMKMPQLGMNQDSAVIVEWLKAAGDKVKSGEAIAEIETDKATVEVEAPADGFLTGLRAVGSDVPVGDVIALIVDNADEIGDHPAAEPVDAPGPDEPETLADGDAAPPPEPIAAPTAIAPGPPATSDRVLASPKAKRMAADRGINLSSLRAQGVREPIHVADLGRVTGGGQSVLGAKISADAFDSLLARSPNADRTMLFAVFAAGGWRGTFGADDFTLALRGLDGTTQLLANPDRGGAQSEGPAQMSLTDLCDTRLTAFASATGGCHLSIAREPGSYTLTLSFSEANLPMHAGIALLDTIAARVEDPIRQLL